MSYPSRIPTLLHSIITAALQAGRESIGYLGTTPTIAVATTAASDGTRIRIIATTSLAEDLCNVLLVRHDAPAFSTPQEALKWIGQRTFAVPYHTCAHAFAIQLLNQSAPPRVIIDATPDLLSRALATGATIGALSGAFIVVRDDLLTQRPDVVKAWLQAEFDDRRHH